MSTQVRELFSLGIVAVVLLLAGGFILEKLNKNDALILESSRRSFESLTNVYGNVDSVKGLLQASYRDDADHRGDLAILMAEIQKMQVVKDSTAVIKEPVVIPVIITKRDTFHDTIMVKVPFPIYLPIPTPTWKSDPRRNPGRKP